MKEEPTTDMIPQRRAAIWEVCKVLPIIAGLMILAVLLLVAIGKFSFDASRHNGLWPKGDFGLYSSALRGLQSFYNPAIELIAFTQFCALLVLPVVLRVFKKRLRIAVGPWVLVALFMVLCQLLGLFMPTDAMGRYVLDSKLPLLLWFEAITLLAIALSYAIYNRINYKNKK
ncbi:MAG TPA: hypothetical protein VK674_05150 [Candidatus Limnocylindria bacterium]|nr:hypothetical protein [Candidatus Limnocylindria bacterium]